MTIERTFQGAIVISKLKDNELITKQYIGYTLKEAKQLFREYYKNYIPNKNPYFVY